jgi:hypothetical protein
MSQLTADLNQQSIEYIRSQIARKTSEIPYFASGKTVTNVITDFDHHPYTRFYRGVYYYDSPIVIEREAGYRKLENSCYNVIREHVIEEPPKMAFESACSTIFPANPDRYEDKRMHDSRFSDSCIVQYR